MNTQALNSLADLICRAQENGKRTPMGIAMAIDAAGRHMSPEVAATAAQAVAAAEHAVAELGREHEESARLRARVAQLEAGLPAMQEALFKALDRVAELEAERHGTNEALSDAAETLREQRDRFETLRALCDAAEHVGIVSGGWFTVEAVRRAVAGVPLPKPDGITRVIAPTQALQGPGDGEHYAVVHHDYRASRDLPELGGAS